MCILLLLDGLGDRSYESLGGQAPLQAVHTPALPIENAHFFLFGYDMVDFPGRDARGALGGLRGREIMYLILNHLDRMKLAGLMDTLEDQPY